MRHPDSALTTLKEIAKQFKDFCKKRGKVSETDTRVKIIDRILKDVCLWPEEDLSREDHSSRGFIDYVLTLHGKRSIVVEAKRQGLPFVLPSDEERKTYALAGTLATDKNIKQAIDQVRMYCDDEGIRYAIATNGYTWIIFRGIRDDIPWRKGRARVFPSIEYIANNFTEFWNLLSYGSIVAGSLDEEFGSPGRVSRNMYRVLDDVVNADQPLRRNRLNVQLQPLMTLIFDDIASQDQIDILTSCYINTGDAKNLVNDLDAVISDSIPQFLIDEGARGIGEPESREGFESIFLDAINIPKGDLFLVLGGIGSGKSTFLKRYQRTSGADLLNQKTLWFSVDFLKAPSNPADLEPFVWNIILTDIRTRYAHNDFEKRRNLREIFAGKIRSVSRP